MKSRVRVPLLLQPANPPLPFVGRASETARLVSVIERGPVAVVCGLSGVGKSGLLMSVLAARFADERERTLVVDAKESADVVARALHAVEQLGGARAKDDRQEQDEPPEQNAARRLIEALEADALWLILENLERIDDAVRDLLSLAQRFCRSARILCICREDPRVASLAPHTVTIGPMSAAELRALLEEIEPGLSDTEAAGIIAHAKGSPWRLRQLSMGGAVDEEGPEKSLLMLAPVAVGLLRTLALVPSSVPQDVLGKATRLPSGDVIESLARRGYVELSARGVRLHDAARPLVEALFDADERAVRAQKLVQAAVDAGSAELAVSLLALIRDVGNAGALLALLERHGQALRAGGHAKALLDVVTALAPSAPVLEPWLCLLVLDVGGDALARVAVLAVDASTLALHAAVLLARGELTRACATADKALAKAGAQQPRDMHACLRALDVLLRARDDVSDRTLLARLQTEPLPGDADVVWRAALTLAASAVRADSDGDDDDDGTADDGGDGDGDASRASLLRAFEGLAGADQRELAAVVARALRDSGDPRRAKAVLGVDRPLSTWNGRAAELECGHVELALGDLEGARVRFARASAFPTPLEQVEGRLGALAARLAVGDLKSFDAELASTLAALHEREAPPALARAVSAIEASLAVLSGRSPARTLPTLDEARKARARARDAGRALDAAAAAAVCVDAAVVAGDRASVAVEAEQLAQASERIGSRRFALHARFAALVGNVVSAKNDGAAPSVPLSSTALVELAQVVHESPVVARRAAALLGESVPLDDVDRAVLAAVSARAVVPQASSVVRKAAGPEWTVDAGTMRIILVDGRTVDLAHRKVLLDLLVTLCANGGAATKEQLLERAWGVREYHPLRHDNRLKVAVRKLRRLLEEILGDDPIETAPDGYRLRGKVRFLKP